MNKILSKSGASDMVVVLIMIVVFAAVAFFVFNRIGQATRNASNNAESTMGTAINQANTWKVP